ncbi:MAG TPA: hypothetical protein VMR25_22680, partial [Planctomycetaceae bacterium]|nr:hypothetical protein [Planctomycetaceae bacterium]
QKHLDGKLARLDKQNFVRSLQWGAASLHDLINARLQACSTPSEPSVSLRRMLDATVNDGDIMNWLERLRIPRHAFKFMHEMIAMHCQSHTDEQPAYEVSRDTFVESRANFSRSLEEYEREMPIA